ncbi:hypothetical protein D9756_002940 [Leucocoprinus leucothites]|uniref:Protein kinase domain-containing protein n=1 Tax=Leucocoprinus leucothites TaxID=201217 RepID=A0A8H5LJV9_9AGAR|nr:hypothetical protein D9756_002940 [Leucoagaricus leucothites]
MASDPSLPPENRIESLAELLKKHDYLDLAGKINHSKEIFPKHTGGYCDVYTGHLVADPSYKVAIKVFRGTDKPGDIKTIERWLNREAVVWHKLKHENVLSFLGLAPDLGRFEACPALISPYCTNGTVGDYVQNSNPPIETRLSLARVARGMEYLHEQDVIHGDLKPSNVLMSDENKPLVCDFGRSSILYTRGFTTKFAGSTRYQAPELFPPENNVTITPNKCSDICAFGLTAFEVWTGKPPFSEIIYDHSVMMHITGGNTLQLPSPPPGMADRLWPILSPCFSITPENRPTIQELVQSLESCVQQS